jgi:OOP family OmpA-OmpF porin
VTSTKSPEMPTAPVGPVARPQSDGSPVNGSLAGGSLAQSLAESGRFVLEDLEFETGSSALGDGTFDSLAMLARYLEEHPENGVTIVGHTDAQGSLNNNIALSRKRAGSVAQRLVSKFGIPRAQLDAEGMGFLSPRASNLTEEGRALNRRVEVILTSTR